MGSDTGFYLDWQIDPVSKLPSGCTLFDNLLASGTEHAVQEYATNNRIGVVGCPKQMLEDETGTPLHLAVEEFADSQELWIADFTKAFVKMQANGAEGLEVGPAGFWDPATIDGQKV